LDRIANELQYAESRLEHLKAARTAPLCPEERRSGEAWNSREINDMNCRLGTSLLFKNVLE